MSRSDFREACVERDGGQCLVPGCEETVTSSPDGPGEVHHIIERKLWDDGGYIPNNGASVCNDHHRLAEKNVIPPHAFYRWAGVEEIHVPSAFNGGSIVDTYTVDDPLPGVDKWGEELDVPPHRELRKYIKYPSSRHLPWSHERDDDDTAHNEVEWAMGYPLIATVKMDGGNCMLVSDRENPVRARNGRHADKDHFDMAKQWYWNNDLYSKIPKHLQVFGEWLYAKHSIHYGCVCKEECGDVGPALRDYFQVLGIYDTRYDVWLGWEETTSLAEKMGLTLVPAAHITGAYKTRTFDNPQKFWHEAYELSQKVVNRGHEGIVIRSALPFHYGQMGQRLGKYVRPGHVKEGEKHWSHRPTVQNILRRQT